MYKAMSDFDLDAEKHSPASSVQSSDCVHEQVVKRIVNVRFTKKEHLLRETSQKSRLHSPAQITQKK